MAMRVIKAEPAGTDANGKDWFRCIIACSETPDTYPTDGQGVDGLADDDGIATGSIFITPDGNEIVLSDDFTFEPSAGSAKVTMINKGPDTQYLYYGEAEDLQNAEELEVAGLTTQVLELTAGWYIYPDLDRNDFTITGDYEDVDVQQQFPIYKVNGDVTITFKQK